MLGQSLAIRLFGHYVMDESVECGDPMGECGQMRTLRVKYYPVASVHGPVTQHFLGNGGEPPRHQEAQDYVWHEIGNFFKDVARKAVFGVKRLAGSNTFGGGAHHHAPGRPKSVPSKFDPGPAPPGTWERAIEDFLEEYDWAIDLLQSVLQVYVSAGLVHPFRLRGWRNDIQRYLARDEHGDRVYGLWFIVTEIARILIGLASSPANWARIMAYTPRFAIIQFLRHEYAIRHYVSKKAKYVWYLLVKALGAKITDAGILLRYHMGAYYSTSIFRQATSGRTQARRLRMGFPPVEPNLHSTEDHTNQWTAPAANSWSAYHQLTLIPYSADTSPVEDKRRGYAVLFAGGNIRLLIHKDPTATATSFYDFRVIETLEYYDVNNVLSDPANILQDATDWLYSPHRYLHADDRVYQFRVVYYQRIAVDPSVHQDKIQLLIPVPERVVEYDPNEAAGDVCRHGMAFTVMTDAPAANASYTYDLNYDFGFLDQISFHYFGRNSRGYSPREEDEGGEGGTP